ncbi:MAG: metalloregulator ArsR/SmtB family transcription factor [Bacteroidota bacterium]
MNPPLVADALVEPAARRLKALADPTRLRILNALRVHGELSVQAIMDEVGLKQANTSKHLGLLAREGLVARRAEGASAYYSLAEPSVAGIALLVVSALRAEAGG